VSGDLLLTGATGYVGMELLARSLERSERRVTLLQSPASSVPSLT
jgi:thioester reductase-like protein